MNATMSFIHERYVSLCLLCTESSSESEKESNEESEKTSTDSGKSSSESEKSSSESEAEQKKKKNTKKAPQKKSKPAAAERYRETICWILKASTLLILMFSKIKPILDFYVNHGLRIRFNPGSIDTHDPTMSTLTSQ